LGRIDSISMPVIVMNHNMCMLSAMKKLQSFG